MRKNQVEPTPPKTAAKPHDAPMSKGDLYFALDCEMVGVGPEGVDSALARVCIVNWENKVVLDTFVKVTVPVTDYRTYVSGVKPEDLLSPEAMEFEDCRLVVKNILCGKILIGHGLENDLKALHLTHPRSDVRDTAAYAPLMRQAVHDGKMIHWPRKLRDLAWEKLERQIQSVGEAHSPIEDAITALDLYKCVRPSWEKDLVQESMKKEREAENERLRLESQMYAASVNRQMAHMNGMPPHAVQQQHHMDHQTGMPHSPTDGYKVYYNNSGYPQPVQYVTAPRNSAETRQPPSPPANYVPYDGTAPPDMAFPQPVYHYTSAAPPPPQASSFFRFPQALVPVYLFNSKSSRRTRRQSRVPGQDIHEVPLEQQQQEELVEAPEQ